MNKTQLIDALAARIGDRRTAANAVDGLLSAIVETVKAGESVSLTGFGVFEPRARAARVGRNPRTGETVAVPAATVPAFRPGTGFRTAVGGDTARAAEVQAPARPTKAKAAAKAKPAAKAATKPAAAPAEAPPAKQASKATKTAKAAAKTTTKTAAKSASKAAPKSGKSAAAAAAKSAGKSTKKKAKK